MADPVVLENAFVAWTTSTASTTYTEIPDVKSVSLPITRAELANSVMGDLAETFWPGLLAAPVEVRVRQAFNSGGIDSVAWARTVTARWKGRLKIRPVDAAVSTTNPSFILNPVMLYGTRPVDGEHGVLLENTLPFRLASNGAATVTRSTST